jgi:hypothetical protein
LSPNTACNSIDVPVKPMNEACGSASRMAVDEVVGGGAPRSGSACSHGSCRNCFAAYLLDCRQKLVDLR